ncbi:MAG: hypothetical protein ACK526_20535 [Planctomyces sp.]
MTMLPGMTGSAGDRNSKAPSEKAPGRAPSDRQARNSDSGSATSRPPRVVPGNSGKDHSAKSTASRSGKPSQRAPVTRGESARGGGRRPNDRIENIDSYLEEHGSRSEWTQGDDDDFGDDGYSDLDYNPFSPPAGRTGVTGTSVSVNTGGVRLAGLGLLIQGWSWLLAVGSMLLILLIGISAGVMKEANWKPTGLIMAMGAMTIVMVIFFGLLFIANFVGVGIRMAAPESSGTKGLAIAEFCCIMMALLLLLMAAATGQGTAADGFLRVFVSALKLAGLVVQLLFLRAFAIYLRRDDLRSRSKLVAIGYIGLTVFSVIAVVFSIFFAAAIQISGGESGRPFATLILLAAMCFGGLGFLVVWGLHVHLLLSLGTAARQSSR